MKNPRFELLQMLCDDDARCLHNLTSSAACPDMDLIPHRQGEKTGAG